MRITDAPSRSFEKIHIDLVGPLPLTELGNLYMLTWQDCLSKYSGTIPLLKNRCTSYRGSPSRKSYFYLWMS